ncbi:MAG TPA: hypothetical protein VEC36_06360 [Patescibacteria group bacterium]|nr:hypothetical protein [Patescibacteria group bacterium]
MKFILLVISLFLQVPAPAQNSDWAKVHTATSAAIEDLYNLRYAEAETGCNTVIKLAPGDPRGYYYKTMLYYTRFSNGGDAADYTQFLKFSQQVEQVCTRLLKNNPRDSRALFYMGGMLGYRSLLHYKAEKHLDAVSDSKKAFSYLEQSLEADSNNADARMGLGLFQYLIAQSPAFLKPALSLAGLSGNRAEGFRNLEAAVQSAVYSKAEARAWLASFYQSEENFQRAHIHLNMLTTLYPKNGWFRLQLAQLLLNNMRKSNDAIMHAKLILLNIAEIPPAERAKIMAEANYILGAASFFHNDFATAEDLFKKAVAGNFNAVTVREANLHLGMIEELSGNRAAAIPYYRNATGSDEAMKLLRTAMTTGDMAVLKAENLFKAGLYDEAYATASEFLKNALPESAKAQLEYTAGRAFFEKGNYTAAESRFLKAVLLKAEGDEWVTPFAYYHMGLAQAKDGDAAAARQSFQKALSFKDFENEAYLQRQVKREIARLK